MRNFCAMIRHCVRFCSNATVSIGLIAWMTKKSEVKKIIEGAEKEVEETRQEDNSRLSRSPFITSTRSRRNMGRDYSNAHC